jgi:RNA polymerase sigma-70 factor, ECF subfamily
LERVMRPVVSWAWGMSRRQDPGRIEPMPPALRVPAVSVASADTDRLRLLYADHAGPLMGYVLRLVNGDHGQAEDVVQETFLRAWQHSEAFAPDRGSPRAWLYTVARNLVVDAARARKVRPNEVGEEGLSLAVAAVEDDHDRMLLGWEVAEAMATLSPDHRAVLRETYFKGLSVAEAAQVLGIPAGTVKSRTYYALRALKAAFDKRGITP